MGLWQEYLRKQGHKILGSIQNASGHGFDIVTKTADGNINIIEVKTSQKRWRGKSNMSRWTDNNISTISRNTNGRCRATASNFGYTLNILIINISFELNCSQSLL